MCVCLAYSVARAPQSGILFESLTLMKTRPQHDSTKTTVRSLRTALLKNPPLPHVAYYKYVLKSTNAVSVYPYSQK